VSHFRPIDLLPLTAVALPAVIIFFLSRYSGWKRLSDRFPPRRPQPRPIRRMGYGVLHGWVGYNGGLWVSSDARGVYLAGMPVLLSFCHAPIDLPWSAVREIRRETRMRSPVFRIVVTGLAEVDLALRPGTFARIAEDARRAGVAGDYD